MAGRMSGRLVVVTTDDERGRALARALAVEGAGVVLATADPAAGGRMASQLAGTGARVAVFCPGPDPEADVEALVELAAEVSPGR
jgi:NAD(P)-dependent dehydrogenase (short-subunit alcohol dehydrogenase family)